MQAAADGGVSSPFGDRNDGHHSIVSELVSLVEHVQAGMKLLEAAIAQGIDSRQPGCCQQRFRPG